MNKIISFGLLSFVAVMFLFGSTSLAHASYFNSYFDRVMPNLEDVYQQGLDLAEQVEIKIANNSGDPDVTQASDLLSQARVHLAEAKDAMNSARMAYDDESTPQPPPFTHIVTNENGVILATSEAGFNMCALYNGVISESEPNRCWMGNIVFINPSLQENAAMLVYATHENYMPFPLTVEHVNNTKAHLKEARRELVQASNLLQNKPRGGSGSSKFIPTPNPELEVIAVSEEVVAPLE